MLNVHFSLASQRTSDVASSIADKKGEGQAVLTVKTDKGEFVLDNKNPNILAGDETDYRFVKRQSQSDPNVWVSLGSHPAVAATGN